MQEVVFETFNPDMPHDYAHAVVVSRFQGKWVFVRHKDRQTLEIPAGRREPGEEILETARRELIEETGATRFHLVPLATYRTTWKGKEGYGLLAFAWIEELGPLSDLEIVERFYLDELPENLTYPTIQPTLFNKALRCTSLVSRLSNYAHVIWDWNGTLLDDIAISVEVINELLSRYKLPLVSVEQYRALFRFPVIEYYEAIGFDFEKLSFEEVGDEFMQIYRERIKQAPLFESTRPTLELLNKLGVHQSILSAASQEHLDEIIYNHGLEGYLQNIYGINNHYAAGKIDRGRELIREAVIPTSQTVLVGDTDHDHAVAMALGTHALLLADGHQNIERLRKADPEALLSRFTLT